jgi:hypothetical protein
MTETQTQTPVTSSGKIGTVCQNTAPYKCKWRISFRTRRRSRDRRNEPRHVEYFCRCSACPGDFRPPRRFYENFIISSITLSLVLTNLDL